MSEQIDKQYDHVGPRYAEEQKKFEEVYSDPSRKAMRKLVPADLTGKDIIEIGFGDGTDASYYESLGAHVSGTDVSEVMLHIAEQKVSESANLVVTPILENPFEDAAFDYAFSRFVLQQFEGLDEVFMEVARMLRPGGEFIFVTGHPIVALAAGGYKEYASHERVSIPLFNDVVVNDIAHAFMDYFTPTILELFEAVQAIEAPLDTNTKRTHSLGNAIPDFLLLHYKRK